MSSETIIKFPMFKKYIVKHLKSILLAVNSYRYSDLTQSIWNDAPIIEEIERKSSPIEAL